MQKTLFYISLLSLCLLSACNFNPVIVNPDDKKPPVDSVPSQDDDTIDTRTPDQRRDPAYLYDLEAVPEIIITVTEADWNLYLGNFDQNPNNRQYVPARFEFRKNADTFIRDSVGLRPRGNTSRRRPEGYGGEMHNSANPQWHHAHFGLKFTEYTTGERFFGSDRMVLKWFNNDPSYCREVFCYDLFRRFGCWSAPRSSYCRLYIHVLGDAGPAYFGIYQMVEGVRNGYLADRRKDNLIADDEGNLWKAAYNSNGIADLSDFNSTGKSKMGISDDYKDYSYALKTNKKNGLEAAQQELYDFMEQMRPLKSGSSELREYLETHMYVDQFLRMLAVNVAVGMWDDYWINGNNYYFYFDSNHRFLFIPYDYDNTLGTNGIVANAGTQNPLQWGSRDGNRLLIRKVLSIADFENTYKQYLKQIVSDSELMQPDAAIQRIKHLQALVSDYLDNDTREDTSLSDQSASWGDIGYRLLSGDDSGNHGSNFFRTKARIINQL
ncbi:MAG: CotH kinase family protein [Paludibacteraceae bacterium]|nr:CotH kinase family protein [Paludibacteraceae bacterium]